MQAFQFHVTGPETATTSECIEAARSILTAAGFQAETPTPVGNGHGAASGCLTLEIAVEPALAAQIQSEGFQALGDGFELEAATD